MPEAMTVIEIFSRKPMMLKNTCIIILGNTLGIFNEC
jgi:hypothetical protein